MGIIYMQVNEAIDGIQCVEDTEPGCTKNCCFYARYESNGKCLEMICQRQFRKDNTDVHFIKVKQ